MGGWGRFRKVPKKCHVLFEWPLTEFGDIKWAGCEKEVANLFFLNK